MKKYLFPICAAAMAFSALATPLDDAFALLDSGDYEAAFDVAVGELKANPKSGDAGRLNLVAGIALARRNDPGATAYLEKAAARGVADAYLEMGRLDAADYDFDSALERYAKYVQLRTRAKKDISTEANRLQTAASEARDMLERVEKLAVIDSISVPADEFFRSYRIAPSAGSLRDASAIPFDDRKELQTVVYTNEGGDFKMWAEPDSTGNLRLMEAIRLTDGSWHDPVATPDSLARGGNAAYPFMMSDGVTLYFAADGDGSIGGYDIFRSNRDAQTGEYMAAQNLGFPYNSPDNDYMLAIDEQTGAGWWATDRNSPAGMVTIYVFVPSEFRNNYDPDTEDLVSLARIDDYKATWGDNDYSALLADIAAIDPDAEAHKVDFIFPMGKGRVFTTWSDFSSDSARTMMRKYLAAASDLADLEGQLSTMRRRYAQKPGDAIAAKIARMERDVESARSKVKKLRSDVYRAESGNNR